MSYLQIIYNELQSIANQIKTDLKAEYVDDFAKVINRTIPDKNCEDGIRYDEFRLLFNANDRNKKMIITSIKESKGKRNDINCRILWTSAYYIVKEFELEEYIFLDWQPKFNAFAVGLRKTIEGLDDPAKQGHSFVYYFIPQMNEESAEVYEEYNKPRSYQNNRPSQSRNNQDQPRNNTQPNTQNTQFQNKAKVYNNESYKNNQQFKKVDNEGWVKNTRNRQKKK